MNGACPREDAYPPPEIARSSRSDCLALLARIVDHAPGGVRGTAVFLLDCGGTSPDGRPGTCLQLDDAAVAEVARRLDAAAPAWHRLLRGEQGEFIVLAQGLVDGSTVLGTAARLVHAFDDALQGLALPSPAEVSIGIAFAPQHGARAQALLAAAESGLRDAMTTARRGQRRKRPPIPPLGSFR
jgi:hypothetical protein